MTRLLLPVIVFNEDPGDCVPETTMWECIADAPSAPILWTLEYPSGHTEYIMFAKDERLTDELGDWGEHKTLALTPYVSSVNLDPEWNLRQFGFKRVEERNGN